ncbi:DUF2000 domain-containing protein [Georgenia halophila]|uniref:DUF2000 domain-containing protein n=1 Tax=Georgenia halophila TaxID=620889 RepID=A0ABP8LBD7_9MICO
MHFDRPKIAVVLRDDLLAWQEINVASFLISGVTAAHPELVGEPYADADDVRYLPVLGHPVLVLVASDEQLATMRGRAVGRGMPISVYTAEMFSTSNDADNRAVVAAVGSDALDLVGIGIAGERNAVDKVTKGGHLHR